MLKRDGTNKVVGTFDMNEHSINNVADPAINQDVATKNYADKNIITVNEDVVRRYLKLTVGSGTNWAGLLGLLVCWVCWSVGSAGLLGLLVCWAVLMAQNEKHLRGSWKLTQLRYRVL